MGTNDAFFFTQLVESNFSEESSIRLFLSIWKISGCQCYAVCHSKRVDREMDISYLSILL